MKYYEICSMRAAASERYWDKVKRERDRVKMKKDHKSWEAKTLYCVVSTSFSKVVQAFAACSVSRCCSLSLSEYIITQCNVMSGSEKRRASDGYRQRVRLHGVRKCSWVFLGVGNEKRRTTEDDKYTSSSRATRNKTNMKMLYMNEQKF